jgi:hypothetical protein
MNRSMNVKNDRARAQRTAVMQDAIMRETQIFKAGLEQTVEDLVRAYKGPTHKIDMGVRAVPAERSPFVRFINR